MMNPSPMIKLTVPFATIVWFGYRPVSMMKTFGSWKRNLFIPQIKRVKPIVKINNVEKCFLLILILDYHPLRIPETLLISVKYID